MGSRLLYGMSHQGLVPAVLGRLHATRRTPNIAIFVLFGIVSLLILSGGVKPLAEATVLLLLVVFTLVNLSLVVLKRRAGEPTSGFDVPVIIPILGALICALLVSVRIHAAFTSEIPGAALAPRIAFGIFVLSFLLYLVMKPKAGIPTEPPPPPAHPEG
jgi:amino acid transporter